MDPSANPKARGLAQCSAQGHLVNEIGTVSTERAQ